MIEMFLRKEKLEPSTISDWAQLEKASLNLGYTDIQGAVKDAKQAGASWQLALPERLRGRARSTKLSTYYRKFEDPLDREKPVEEFIALLGLELEVCKDDKDESDPESVSAIRRAAQEFGADAITQKAVKERARGLSDSVATRIASALDKHKVASG